MKNTSFLAMVVQFHGHLLYDTRHIVISRAMGTLSKKAGTIGFGPIYTWCGVIGTGSFLLRPVTISK